MRRDNARAESEITNLERSLKLGNGELWQKYQDSVADSAWDQARRLRFLRQWKADHAAACAAYYERAHAQQKPKAQQKKGSSR